MAAYLRIFCRFSDAARLQKSRLQAAKVFGIGSNKPKELLKSVDFLYGFYMDFGLGVLPGHSSTPPVSADVASAAYLPRLPCDIGHGIGL